MADECAKYIYANQPHQCQIAEVPNPIFKRLLEGQYFNEHTVSFS
jgi:hypothetical protein